MIKRTNPGSKVTSSVFIFCIITRTNDDTCTDWLTEKLGSGNFFVIFYIFIYIVYTKI